MFNYSRTTRNNNAARGKRAFKISSNLIKCDAPKFTTQIKRAKCISTMSKFQKYTSAPKLISNIANRTPPPHLRAHISCARCTGYNSFVDESVIYAVASGSQRRLHGRGSGPLLRVRGPQVEALWGFASAESKGLGISVIFSVGRMSLGQ